MAKTTGIRTRHGRACASRTGRACNCSPSYEAWVWSPRDERKLRRTFSNLAAAKGWRHDAASDVRKGALRAPTPRTIREAWDEWLAGARDGSVRTRGGDIYKPSVIRSYETSMNLRVLPPLGAAKLATVTRLHVQDMADHMLADGLDPSTIRNTLMPLRAVYRRALARGEIAVSPLAALELPAVRGRRERVVSPEEARLLIAGAPDEERVLWATALYAGLRRGELMALRWDDVDLGAGRLSVRASWDIREGRVAPKSRAGIRDVSTPEVLRVHLADHRLRTWAEGLVFGRTPERPFEPVGVAARADEAWKTHGLERVTLHECRHAYSTFLDAAAVWPTRADRYMGHADHSTPGRYRHQLEGQLAEDAALLDAYLNLTGAHPGAHVDKAAQLSEN